MELEHARDDLMFEVHKLQQGNADYEKNVPLYFVSTFLTNCFLVEIRT